ncbi:MAG: hypothetical protein OXC07_10345 [Kistimonas sp.]|nr:hypothetical protein [Kistimonas sp.]
MRIRVPSWVPSACLIGLLSLPPVVCTAFFAGDFPEPQFQEPQTEETLQTARFPNELWEGLVAEAFAIESFDNLSAIQAAALIERRLLPVLKTYLIPTMVFPWVPYVSHLGPASPSLLGYLVRYMEASEPDELPYGVSGLTPVLRFLYEMFTPSMKFTVPHPGDSSLPPITFNLETLVDKHLALVLDICDQYLAFFFDQETRSEIRERLKPNLVRQMTSVVIEFHEALLNNA